jgi:type IV fimbrial biogenesis protein FimT
MTYQLINVTVLFLGVSIATLLMGRIVFQTIKNAGAKPLKSVEESIRAQALLGAIAVAVCKRAEMGRGNQPHASGAAEVLPAATRSIFRPGTVNGPRPANQPAWRAAPLRAAGFTTPELLISVTVMAILTGVSVPAFTGLVLDTRVKTAAVDVYTTMVYARSEAVKRNANVDIIPTGGNWKNGWTVQAGTAVLKTVGPSTTGLDNITSPATITYRSDGRLTTPGTVTYVFGVSANPQVTPRRVIVDTSGRASIRQGLS